jgi:transposase
MVATRRTLGTLRNGRVVTRRYWFSPHLYEEMWRNECEHWEPGTAGSWADAVNRIAVTGETLVVDISDAESQTDRKERRRLLLGVRAALRVVSRRRGLRLSGRQSGQYMHFRVV